MLVAVLLTSGVQLTGIALIRCAVEINEVLQGVGVLWVWGCPKPGCGWWGEAQRR